MTRADAANEVANYLRTNTDAKGVAFAVMADAILEIVACTLGPEDIGMEKVNPNDVLAWPWYRYPAEPREQFRGHGPDRYKETYPL